MDAAVQNLVTYVKICGSGWLVVYLAVSLVFGFVAHLTLHLMVVGLLICLMTYFRLPAPRESRVEQVLGPEPKPNMSEKDVAWEVAHRAAGLDAPENSIEALRLAASNGARMVEFDVSFTSNMSPVVFHDDSVDRTTQSTGQVTSFTLANLQKLDLAVKHPLGANFAQVFIPDLDSFVAECVRLNLRMIIDLKSYEIPEEVASVILALYTKYPVMRSTAMVTSFFPHLLYRIRSLDPDVVCSVSHRPYFFGYSTYDGPGEAKRPRFSGIFQLAAIIMDFVYPILLENFLWLFVGISAVLVHKSMVTKQYVSSWRRKGVRVMAWTVNDPLEKAFLRHVIGVPSLTDTMERVKPDQWVISDS